MLPAVWNTIWPLKVPAIKPALGKLAVMIPMVSLVGAVPLGADIVSQLPPSEVLVPAVQFNVPTPALRTCMVCETGLPVAVGMKKLTWPGRLSKNALPTGETVKVTGMVRACAPPLVVTTIWPV